MRAAVQPKRDALITIMFVTIPLRTGNGQNNREHWRAAAKRARAERTAVAWVLAHEDRPQLPAAFTLTRIGPSPGLDAHDNLRGALKHCVDAVAEWMGVDDRNPLIEWKYAQRRAPLWGVEISAEAS